MGLRLVGQVVDVVKGLDILGWVRNVEASDGDPALTVKQNGASSVGAKLVAGAPSTVPIRVDAAVGQSANIVEIRKSTGTLMIRVTSNGSLYVLDAAGTLLVAFNTDSGGPPEQLYVSPYSVSVVGQTVKGRAGQSADLQQWQDSAATVLARVLATGEVMSTVALRTKHEGASTPTGGASGDIRVGNSKIWVNDTGTWKSVAIT